MKMKLRIKKEGVMGYVKEEWSAFTNQMRRKSIRLRQKKCDFFPMQLIVTSRLSEEENFWLRYLTNNITEVETAKKIMDEYEKHQNEGLYQSVMELIVNANNETFKEAKSMCQALKELFREDFEDEFIAARTKGHAEGHAEGHAGMLIESINNLINNLGISLEAACQAIGSSVQSYEAAKKLLEK